MNLSAQHPTIREKPKLEIDYRKLRNDQKSMHFDTIRPKPAISYLVRKSHGGKIEEDKRYRLWKQIRGVNGQLQDFHLRMTKVDYKKAKIDEKEPGLNTAREKPLQRL